MDLKEKIKSALAAHKRVPMERGPVPAAVLVPLVMRKGGWHLLFTKRATSLNHHRGEISFPGGVCQADDKDAVDTALRETFEEVGIFPQDVQVLGVLDDFYSIYGYVITPYVGVILSDGQYIINTSEIDRIIEVPLDHLLNPDIFRAEDWSLKGRSTPVYFYTYLHDEIWGVTAAILKQFLDLVFCSELTRQ